MNLSILSKVNPLSIVDETKKMITDQLHAEIGMEKLRTHYTLKHENMSVILETIKSEREIFCEYIGQDIKRRKNLYSNVLPMIDNALENNDLVLLKWGLNQIVNIISDDPFVDYEDFSKKLNDSKTSFTI